MYNIHINDYYLNIKNQWTVLQVCVLNNIDIPRFCYHEKLFIAGNCRMCLVEEIKQLKPLVSCSILINDNMFIYTNTLKVKKAREAVMEFLLINHPLDCPICDQGGECDLQDQSLIFGNDKGRFYEYKRSVENKDCGVFVKTIMNRCIHCTRCVRYINEYVDSSLGITGRGSKMEIGFYINKIIDTEILGNIIDLCPVGALTSKPYSYLARPWELKIFSSIDILDSFNSNIRIDLRGSQILRILPKINDNLNEEWITDKIRFCYDGLRIQRLVYPMINNKFNFIKLSWQKIFFVIKRNFYILLNQLNKNKIKFLFFKNFFGDFLDIESLIMLKLFSNKYNFDYYLNPLNNDFVKNFNFNLKFRDFIYLTNCIFVNINLRLSLPNLNIKFKNLLDKKDIFFYYIGFYSNFLYYCQNLGINLIILLNIFEGLHWLCNKIYLNKVSSYFFINNKINCLFLNNITFNFINIENILLNSIDYNLNLINFKSNKYNYYFKNNNIYYNLGFNEQKIFYNYNNIHIYQGYIGDINTINSNIILPATTFIEKNTSFFNFIGLYQKLTLILSKLGESKDDWQIIKIFSFFLGYNINYKFIDFLKINYYKYFLFQKNIYNYKYLIILKTKFYNNLFFSYQNVYYNDIFSNISKNINLQKNYLKLNYNFKRAYCNDNNKDDKDKDQNYMNIKIDDDNYYQNYMNVKLKNEQQNVLNDNNFNELNNEDLNNLKSLNNNKFNFEMIKKKIPKSWFQKLNSFNILIFDFDKYKQFLETTWNETLNIYDYVFKWYPDDIKNYGYPIHGGRAHPWVKPEVTKMWDEYKHEHGKTARVPDEIQKQVMWCDPNKFGKFTVINALEDEFINVFHEGSENIRKARKFLRAWTWKDRPTRIPVDKVYYIGPTEALNVKVIYFIHDKHKNLIKNMIYGNVESSKTFFQRYECFLGIEFNDELEFNKGVSYDIELNWFVPEDDI